MMRRRTFIQVGTTGLGGLLLGIRAMESAAQSGLSTQATPFAPNAFLRIDADGRVTFTAPVPEMGQGIRTGLCMIIAEEVGVLPGEIHIEQADADERRYGPRQRAAGSGSIKSYWMPLREAGATARHLLVTAAANRLSVPPDSCTASLGRVMHAASNRSLSYGELVADAALLPAPASVTLKDPRDFSVIGVATPNLDCNTVTTGAAQFGLDVERPGMVRAVIARCPVYGGRARAIDDAATREVAGVLDVIRIDPEGPDGRPSLQGGVAVIADSTWAALKGREALKVQWDEGPNAEESTAALKQQARDHLVRRGTPVLTVGDAYAGMANAARKVSADYEVPFLAHAPMEPMNCVADVRDGKCELWAPTQVPSAVKSVAARSAGVPEANVVVHVTRMGGGFGRRLGADYAAEAAVLSRRMAKPVQVVWTRDDDMRHGFYRPFGRHHLEAGLDAAGNITGWLHRATSTSRYAFRPSERPAASEMHSGDFPGNVLPHVAVEFTNIVSNVQRGPWRSPRDNANAFVIESFFDEVAHAAGRDPLELRLELLGADRELPYEGQEVFNTGRLRRVLTTAAERADWGRGVPAGSGRGLASFYAYESYVAHVAEVSVDRRTGRIRVHRLTAAIDCGIVVNPSGVRAQVEGAAIDALSSLYREITLERGRVTQGSFADYRMIRIDETPEIDVVLLNSGMAPTGAGEPPFPSVAPAVLNAVFSATGVRIRTLPIDRAQLRR